MRILHVQDHTIPEMSGYAFRSRYVVDAQRRLGIDAEVLSSPRHRVFDAPVEDLEGLRFHRTAWPTGAWNGLQLKIPFWRERVLTGAMTRRIVEVGRAFGPHALHAHSPFFNGQAALRAGKELSVPVVYEIRAFWEDDAVDKNKFAEGSFLYRQVRRLETVVCKQADRVVTICEGLRNDLVERGIPAEKIVVVPNGVDVDRFQPVDPDPALAGEIGIAGSTVVGFIGSFFHYEGLPLLVEATARLRERYPRLRLLLVGGGEDLERTRERARELGVEDRVIFTGKVPHDRVADYYALVDLVVYPRLSLRLTELVTPLKPLEALAMGKGVVGSDVGGIEELLRDIPGCHLFPSGSVSGLCDALTRFLDTPPSERSRASERAQEVIRSGRSWEDAVSRILPVYESIMEGSLPNPC